jgi:flagellar protein FliS
MYKRSEAEIDECESLMKMLHASFVEVAKTDDSAPLMRNTEQVYAGYTYGRSDVNSSSDVNPSRGFFV